MATHQSETATALFDDLAHAAREKAAPDERDVFTDFIRRYYEPTPLSLIEHRTVDDLCAQAYSHWCFARQRKTGQHKVRVFNPTVERDGYTVPFTVIETATDDAPFLVDSISMAVRDTTATIDWVNHPVFEVERDEQGQLTAVLGPADRRGDPESYIHMEFDPLPDESSRSALAQAAERTLRDLNIVVRDWQAMRERLQNIVAKLEQSAGEQTDEVIAFLRWLDDEHFTFLGYREHQVQRERGGASLEPVPGTGLGLLHDDQPHADAEGFVAPAAQLAGRVESTRPVVITKGNTRSPVHHPEYMDIAIVKSFDDEGRVIGTHRFLGLFAAEVYSDNPRTIPILRGKVDYVLKRSNLRAHSHAAKNLEEILETLPRDELFQSNEDSLAETANGILDLRDRQQVRLFMRRDRYNRYYYCMVYVPRDQHSPELRDRMSEIVRDSLNGHDIETEEQFLLRGMARLLFTVHTPPDAEPARSPEEIEALLKSATRGWRDRLRDALIERVGTEEATKLLGRFRDGLPVSYTESTDADEAASDLRLLARVGESQDMALRVVPGASADSSAKFRLKIYVGESGLALSDVLPSLEHFGVRVLNQRPHRLQTRNGDTVWVEEFDLLHPSIEVSSDAALRDRFEITFARLWRAEIEDDSFNGLVISAGLRWRQVVLVRALCKYLLQTPLPFSQTYMEQMLSQHAEITTAAIRLFEARFDPNTAADERQRREADIEQAIAPLLDQVTSLDADRLMRALVSVVRAAVRTNFYQKDQNNQRKSYISIKLSSDKIAELPDPRPLFETFVYSREVEAVHLRGGKVARGGIRWSDRREDFRTEVLGLMKAQMVKNSVIVPIGAKGGFVVKRMPAGADRDTQTKTGIACYQTFMRGLLDITDNLVESRCEPPPDVVRLDDDDPYLVVAADKGTASFSDIANRVAAQYNFWLDDAFASGGSHGYDHKKIGITARGAWESVTRHFFEMGRDTQQDPFTVIGIGDMAGDVFGNGMLLSPAIKLVAAFNHMHIFIDPDPDPAVSFAERKRLFVMPRSAWTDYSSELISKGGGVFSRADKQVNLSPEARAALAIDADVLTPSQLIHEILQAPVDLLWNGGIGTYVKASTESHVEVGDRTNEAVRVNGRELRCKVVGEGGNLGLSQRGRIEYALRGGRVNTDFIDNSGGVDCSDREVNIKIALSDPMGRGELNEATRDELLEAMTGDIAQLVLHDNVLQSQAISLMQRASPIRLEEHILVMRLLEGSGLVHRTLEALPDEERLAERRAHTQGFKRPEIAVLLSYSKLDLYQKLLDSKLPDDPYLDRVFLETFPDRLRNEFPKALERHRLRREITATAVTNTFINRMGMAFAHRLSEENGIRLDQAAWAFIVARDTLELESLWQQMQTLENAIDSDLFYSLFERIIPLLSHAIVWILGNIPTDSGLGDAVAAYAGDVHALAVALPEGLTGAYHTARQNLHEELLQAGVPENLAKQLANVPTLSYGFDIAHLKSRTDLSLPDVVTTYFQVGEMLLVPWLFEGIASLRVNGRWQALARANLREDTYRLHRNIAARVLAAKGSEPEERIRNWQEQAPDRIRFGLQRLSELSSGHVAHFQGMAVAVRELRKLSHAGVAQSFTT